MTIQVNHELLIDDVEKGDVLNGMIVHTVKVGPKWTELRAESGRLIKRGLSGGDEVSVTRTELTDEEKAEAAAARQAEWDARSLEALESDFRSKLAEQPGDILIKSIEKAREKGYIEEVDHWQLESFLEAQAVHKVYLEINGVMGNGERDLLTAYAIVLMRTMDIDRYPGNGPLSRSTSHTSNLYEDLDRWAYDKVRYDTRWSARHIVNRRINELLAEQAKEA